MKRKAPSPPSFLDETLPPRDDDPENLDFSQPFHARKRRILSFNFEDTNWPQLETEYQSFTKSIIESGYYFPKFHKLTPKLLNRLDSEDERERAALGTLLSKIYNRFPQLRISIRKSVYVFFQEFNSSSESKHNGIPELLNFMGEVVEMRKSPDLEEEFKVFLLRSLIPLYKSKWLVMFYPNLRNCISKFIIKDLNLAESVFQGMIKFWPKQGSSREYFFLDAIEGFLMEVEKDLTFTPSVVGLLEKIAFCVSSTQFVVAGKALGMINPNGGLGTLIRKSFKEILPIFFPRLKETVAEHWRPGTRKLAEEIIQELKKIDPVYFDDCYISSLYNSGDEEETLKLNWGIPKGENLLMKFEDAWVESCGF